MGVTQVVPTGASKPDDRVPVPRLVILCVATVAAGVIFAVFRDLRHDDAYITLQFARNVGRGTGFVFNTGQPVLGSTSPLHVLVLACAFPLAGSSLASIAILIGSVGVAAQAVFLYLLLERTSRLLATATGILVLVGYVNSFSHLSLETNLLAALVLGVIWSLDRRRAVLCGVLLGLAFLCRYDSALLVPITTLAWWRRYDEFPKRLLATSFAVVAPWLVWSTLYFGSFLPQTYWAKQQITAPGTYLSIAMSRFATAPWRDFPPSYQHALAWVTPLLWGAGLLFVIRHARQVLPIVLHGAALALVYSRLGPHPGQTWHLYFAGLAFDLLAVIGVFGWSARRFADRRHAIPAAALMGLMLVCAVRDTATFAATYRQAYWLGYRHQRYTDVAEWLRTHLRRDATVLAYEVGTLGYLSQRHMIDPSGLINDTNDFPRNPSMENLAQVIEHYRPHVLVLNSPAQGRVFETRSPYRMVRVFDTDPWSTILVATPEVLTDSHTFDTLRKALPRRANMQR